MVKRKATRRRISLGRNIIRTTEPADWVIGIEKDGVWSFLCRASIIQFDPSAPQDFSVERMTRDQARERIDFIRTWGSGILQEMRPVLFSEFRRAIGPGARFREIASIEDAIQADRVETDRIRQEKRQEAMRSLFSRRPR